MSLWKKHGAVIRGLLIFVIAFFCMIDGALDSRFDPDSVRDLLRARDCLEGLRPCRDMEIDTSMIGLRQGPLWVYFLVVNRALGFDPVGVTVLVVALLALSAVVLDRWVSRYFSRMLAPTVCVLWMIFMARHTLAIIWNPTFGFFPLAAFYLSLSHVIEHRKKIWLILAGLSLYWSIDAHVSCFVLVPILVGVTMISGTFKDTLIALAALAVPAVLVSWGAFSINLGAGVGLRFPLAGAIVAAGVVGVLCRPIWRRISELHRHSIVLLLSSVTFLVALAVFQRHSGGVVFRERYVISIAPALMAAPAVLWANLVDLTGRWKSSNGVAFAPSFRFRVLAWVFSWVLAAAILINADCRKFFRENSPFSRIMETRILADFFEAKGLKYNVLRQSLYGPHAIGFGYPSLSLSVYADRLPDPPTMEYSKQVRLVRARNSWFPARIPPGWEKLDMPNQRAALVGIFDGWLRMTPVKILIDGKPAPEPLPYGFWIKPKNIFYANSYTSRVWFGPKMFTVDQLGLIDFFKMSPGRVSIDLPIEIGDDAEEHVIDMLDQGNPDWKPWAIESVEGVSHEIGPGGDYVIVRSNGPRRGTVRITSSGTKWNYLPLNVFETTPAEKDVRAVALRFVNRQRYFPAQNIPKSSN